MWWECQIALTKDRRKCNRKHKENYNCQEWHMQLKQLRSRYVLHVAKGHWCDFSAEINSLISGNLMECKFQNRLFYTAKH